MAQDLQTYDEWVAQGKKPGARYCDWVSDGRKEEVHPVIVTQRDIYQWEADKKAGIAPPIYVPKYARTEVKPAPEPENVTQVSLFGG